jgi:hypothetical protein
MDGQRLDDLSRILARGPSRRAVLTGLGAILTTHPLTAPAPVGAQGDGWVEVEGFGLCRLPRFPCANSNQCCAGGCQADGTCGCRKRGKSAIVKAVCCSGKKKRGDKGVCR